jgi:hypothetical protein
MTEANPEESIAAMLSIYRFSVGVGVPIVISALGVAGKKVARGAGWSWEDWYVGSELTLAGIAGAAANLFEFLKPDRVTFGVLEKKLLAGNIGIAFLGFLLYIFMLSFKQDYGPNSGKSKKKQLWVMFGVSNVLGLLTLFGALILMAP